MNFGPDEFIIVMWVTVGLITLVYFYTRKQNRESSKNKSKKTTKDLPVVTMFFNTIIKENETMENPDQAKRFLEPDIIDMLKTLGEHFKLVLIVHAEDAKAENTFQEVFLDQLSPMLLPEKDVLYCRIARSRIHMVSQLKPFAHLDYDEEVMKQLERRVSNRILIKKEFATSDPQTPSWKNGSLSFHDAARLLLASRVVAGAN